MVGDRGVAPSKGHRQRRHTQDPRAPDSALPQHWAPRALYHRHSQRDQGKGHAVGPHQRKPLPRPMVDQRLREHPPREAGEQITAQHFGGGQDEDQRPDLCRQPAGHVERQSPIQGQTARQPRHSKRCHPGIAFRVDHEGRYQPRPSMQEIAKAKAPPDRCGLPGRCSSAVDQQNSCKCGQQDQRQIIGCLPKGRDNARKHRGPEPHPSGTAQSHQ